MSAVVLRDAHWRDIPAMARLERAAFPEDPWPEATFWAELAQRPRRSYVVAVTDGSEDPDHLLGQAGLDLAGDVADIMTVAVDAAAAREKRRIVRPCRCLTTSRAMNGQAPWFSGSSWTQTSSAFG